MFKIIETGLVFPSRHKPQENAERVNRACVCLRTERLKQKLARQHCTQWLVASSHFLGKLGRLRIIEMEIFSCTVDDACAVWAALTAQCSPESSL